MNIDDLWNDIYELEEEGLEESSLYKAMVELAFMYDKDRNKALELQTKFRDDFPDWPKINIV